MTIPALEDLGNLEGKRVLVRCDFNVPLEGGLITDDLRIKSALPTLRYLLEAGATVTTCSHLGRPNGKPAPEFTLDPVRERLQELLPEVQLLENLRFNTGETDNSSEFVAELIAGQDIYVNDAFGASHRSHASIVGPPAFLPSAAGRLLEKEVHVLKSLRENPKRPLVGIMGGSKVSDKLGVIEALLDVVDELIVGGGMCFTFLAAKGSSVGASLLEENMIEKCGELLATYDSIRLPLDVTALSPEGVIGNPSAGGEVRQMGTSIPEGWMGLDIGPGTAVEFCDIISEARTVLWNGPMGVFEDSRFSAGTRTIAEAVAGCRGFTVVGGGDSAAAAKLFGVDGEMNHVSTGGGATLELIEKGDLPGLAALRDSQRV
ncbi:MAG: phosphoglycerate kinase [marine actinobacterium MedAcidi-G2B]|nr:MAG: phosphoglycerate kinase [marine actinobacterium MedAcidi-G2B]|tara:strand:+ start:322 stop:1446 length:1125 start_codon:yes stop_codon:yes gene_type:complete